MVDRDEELARSTAKEIAGLGRPQEHRGGRRRQPAGPGVPGFGQTTTELGSLDVTVNNAAINRLEPILEITPENMDEMFRINVHGIL
ncbi:SDR family NAD(P)-dependent oxidoreductase [Pseudonocardia lutea]|uniref:SDR family NAD(P)-dependent oxidoreductase n=1 Tax=Pseudonocardia lutea TaxID=2172015 RepID=A0ABW1I408_9PSEU